MGKSKSRPRNFSQITSAKAPALQGKTALSAGEFDGSNLMSIVRDDVPLPVSGD
jgi:hypothetical protein